MSEDRKRRSWLPVALLAIGLIASSSKQPAQVVAERRRFEAKDGVTLSIAFMALIVSGTTAYFSLIRQIDELRISEDKFYFINKQVGEQNLRVWGGFGSQLAFINSGNRSIIVMEVDGVLLQPGTKPLNTALCDGEVTSLNSTIEPFVIRGGEILMKPATLNIEVIGGSNRIPITPQNEALPSYQIGFCLSILAQTIDGKRWRINRPLFQLDLPKSDAATLVPYVDYKGFDAPFVKQWSTVFD